MSVQNSSSSAKLLCFQTLCSLISDTENILLELQVSFWFQLNQFNSIDLDEVVWMYRKFLPGIKLYLTSNLL